MRRVYFRLFNGWSLGKWQQEQGLDGGYGWLVVTGALLGQFTSFGTTSSW